MFWCLYLGVPKIFAELATHSLGRMLYLALVVVVTVYHGSYAGIALASLIVVIFYLSVLSGYIEGMENPAPKEKGDAISDPPKECKKDDKGKCLVDAETDITRAKDTGANINAPQNSGSSEVVAVPSDSILSTTRAGKSRGATEGFSSYSFL